MLCCSNDDDLTEEEKKALEKKKKEEKPFVVSHTGKFLYVWDIVIIADIVASLVIVPLRIGFNLQDRNSWIGLDIFMDLLFVADIVLTFFKTFDDAGETVDDRELIRWRYLKGTFVMDVISTFPADYIVMAALPDRVIPATRVNRILRLRRLADFLLSWEKNSSLKPSVIGILKSIFMIMYMSHFTACIFHGVTIIEDSSPSFTSTRNPIFKRRGLTSRYLRSFYWALVSLTGYNASTPVSWLECSLAVLVTITSIAVFGTIIGTFGNLLTNLDSSKLYFRQKLDAINDYMRYKKIPEELQDEVRQYYNYMWKSGKGLEQNEAVDRLPVVLRTKMNFHMNHHSIRKVSLFEGVAGDLEFMGEIVKSLRPRIGLPNSYIVKKGEYGTEMFFISRGELNVVIDSGIVVSTLKEGMFFGEIALLYKTRRTASIVARTFCDMYILTKDEFARVMRRYPDQSRGIKEEAKKRYDKLMADEKAKEEAEQRKREEEERAAEEARAAAFAANPRMEGGVSPPEAGVEPEEQPPSMPPRPQTAAS